jgi:hypothetical protein
MLLDKLKKHFIVSLVTIFHFATDSYLCRTVDGYWFLHSLESQNGFQKPVSDGALFLFLTIFMWEAKKSRTIRSCPGLLRWWDYEEL